MEPTTIPAPIAVQARPRPMCRHCGIRPVARPRGLCWTDYYAPGVRDLYPASTSKFMNRGHGIGMNFNPPLPAEPTDAVPGSEEKILVLMERVRRRESLWHPDDCRLVHKPGPSLQRHQVYARSEELHRGRIFCIEDMFHPQWKRGKVREAG